MCLCEKTGGEENGEKNENCLIIITLTRGGWICIIIIDVNVMDDYVHQ